MGVLLSFPAAAISPKLQKINVLADPSLSVAMSALAREFTSRHGIAVTTAYGPAREHAQSIMLGMEADVFITANSREVDSLKTQGLLDVYSVKQVAKNRLSLATYRDNKLELIMIPKLVLASSLAQVDPEFTFAIGDPDFQYSGYFALKALRGFEMMKNLEPHMLFIRGQRDLLKTVREPGSYGILYQSDAKKDENIKILSTFPEVAHSPIHYYGAAVAGAQMQTARRFVDYLTSDAAQEILSDLGFEPLITYSDESGHLARGSTVSESVKPL